MIKSMNTLEVQKTNNSAVRRMVGITADSNQELPERLQYVRAGVWRDSAKGDLDITQSDLLMFKANFDAGLAQMKDQDGTPIGLPVDFAHNDHLEAAFWIKAFEVEGDILWASQIEYTKKGRDALLSGEYKGFSPSFFPRCKGWWFDHEDPTIQAQNVAVGGALTNIPFFRGLTAIKASASSGDDKNIIYINADAKGEDMNLETIRAKNAADVTAEEKAFLEENKANLTADELLAHGITTKPEEQEEEEVATNTDLTPEQKEAAEIQASIKSGQMVLVEASKLDGIKTLEAKVEASAKIIAGYEKERVEASVKAHAARGAIKTDQIGKWTDRILADASLADDLAELPSNQILANELGKEGGDDVSAVTQIQEKATALITANQGMSMADAISQVRASDKELAARYDAEIKG
jgi:hypothetical protein